MTQAGNVMLSADCEKLHAQKTGGMSVARDAGKTRLVRRAVVAGTTQRCLRTQPAAKLHYIWRPTSASYNKSSVTVGIAVGVSTV